MRCRSLEEMDQAHQRHVLRGRDDVPSHDLLHRDLTKILPPCSTDFRRSNSVTSPAGSDPPTTGTLPKLCSLSKFGHRHCFDDGLTVTTASSHNLPNDQMPWGRTRERNILRFSWGPPSLVLAGARSLTDGLGTSLYQGSESKSMPGAWLPVKGILPQAPPPAWPAAPVPTGEAAKPPSRGL